LTVILGPANIETYDDVVANDAVPIRLVAIILSPAVILLAVTLVNETLSC
jgi:hypothetical protein